MTDTPILHLSLPVHDLAAARSFYEDVLGCRIGRVRSTWLDVWFFGLQLTLHERPFEVLAASERGVRHFGVVLSDRNEFGDVVSRVDAAEWGWISEPELHSTEELSGKLGGKLADPSGNVIEFKYYDDPAAYLHERP